MHGIDMWWLWVAINLPRLALGVGIGIIGGTIIWIFMGRR
jgi:hypothetical protein